MQTAGGAPLNAAHGSDSDSEDGSAGGSRRRPRLSRILVAVALAVVAADVATKVVANAVLTDRPPVELLGGLLTLRLVRNPGAAFGLATGYTVLLSLVALGVVIVVIRLSRMLRSTPWAVALGLLLGGALGNLADRVFRQPGPFRGHVVDFLELPRWPVFNLADTAICSAAVFIVVLSVLGRHLDGTVDRRVADAPPHPGDGGTDEGAPGAVAGKAE